MKSLYQDDWDEKDCETLPISSANNDEIVDFEKSARKKGRVKQEYFAPSVMKTCYKRKYSCKNPIRLVTRVYMIVTRIFYASNKLLLRLAQIRLSNAYIFFRELLV